MAATSRTWFYNEPEHRAYYIEERVNQNLWANRFGSIYLDCTRAEPPFQMNGKWNGIEVTIEWLPKQWFIMRTSAYDETLVRGFRQVLQLTPTVTFTQPDGTVITEWHPDPAMRARRLEEVQGRADVYDVKRYKG